MKRIKMIIMAVAIAVSVAGAASAQPGTPRLDRRAARQEWRIREGARAGQLTRRETYRLRMDQRHIRRMGRCARADGRLGPRERFRLQRAYDRQSARIWRLRHNDRSI
jgi:hypothetical protein